MIQVIPQGSDEVKWHPSKSDNDQKEDPTILEADPSSHKQFTWMQGQLRRKGKLVIGKVQNLRTDIITLWPSGPHGGYLGLEATLKRLFTLFYWKNMRTEVKEFIQNVMMYSRKISEILLLTLVYYNSCLSLKLYGLKLAWTSLMVCLNLMVMRSCYDRDVVFLSSFWQELLSLQGVLLHTSTAYHPQFDGQTEVLNRCLETYLRCYCSDDASNWFSCLTMVEYWYNTCFHSAIQITPYEALYGRPPPLYVPYLPGESSSTEVDTTLLNRELKLQLLKHHLLRA
ncbi:putative protein isoform X1 [Capsicum annuum]